MLARWQYHLLLWLGVGALLLAVANAVMFTLNRGAQIELNQRQQYIQQTVPLENLYREIVKTLAEMAVKGNDRQLLGMLTAQGLTITANPPAAPASPAASRPAAK